MSLPRTRHFHLWLICFLSLCAALLAGALAFNIYYDPYMLFASADGADVRRNGQRGKLSSYSYITKAAQIIRLRPASILLGTSVVDGGVLTPGSMANYYAPDPKAYKALERQIAPHAPVYNAAIRGKHLYAMYDYLQHAYVNNPRLEEVYLGIDWTSFLAPQPGEPLSASVSVLGHTTITLDFLLKHSLSLSALELSYGMWEEGHPVAAGRLRKVYDRLSSFTRAAVAGDNAPVSFTPVQGQDSNKLLLTEKPFQTHNFIFSAHFVYSLNPEVVPLRQYEQQSLQYLKKIVQFCRERNIRLVTFNTPKHPYFWAFMQQFGLQGQADAWLRDVVAVTPVVDFSGAFEFGPDPETYHVMDSLHFVHSGGEVILPQLLRPAPGLPGAVVVTPDNVDAVIASYHTGLERWKTLKPEMAASVHAISREWMASIPTADTPNHLPLMPVVYEPDYKGYRVYKCMYRFIAVPVADAHNMSLASLIQYAKAGWPSAATLEALIERIDGVLP